MRVAATVKAADLASLSASGVMEAALRGGEMVAAMRGGGMEASQVEALSTAGAVVRMAASNEQAEWGVAIVAEAVCEEATAETSAVAGAVGMEGG